MKVYICIFLISLLLIGCNKAVNESEIVSTAVPTTKTDNNMKDIAVDTFRCWINEEAWYQHQDIVDELKDKAVTVSIYYELSDSEADDNLVHIYVLQANHDIHLAFVQNYEGFESEPAVVEYKKKELVFNNMVLLGEEKIDFEAKEMVYPKYPVTSQRYRNFLKKAKKELERILKQEKEVTYQVYISDDFTEQHPGAEVYLIKNGIVLHTNRIWGEIQMDNGKTKKDIVRLEGGTSFDYDWSDESVRENFKDALNRSILEFEVKT